MQQKVAKATKGGGKICRHLEKCVDEGVPFCFGRYKKSGRVRRQQGIIYTEKNRQENQILLDSTKLFFEKEEKNMLFQQKKLLLSLNQ